MQLNMKPREQVARAWTEERMKRPPAPRPINVRNVGDIAGDELLWFHGRYLLAPPTPFEEGGQLADWQLQLEQLARVKEPTREQLAELRGVLTDAVGLMGTLVRPLRYRNHYLVGFLARLIWRCRRNPFRHATVAEVGWLLGFFSGRRTMPRVRLETGGLHRAR